MNVSICLFFVQNPNGVKRGHCVFKTGRSGSNRPGKSWRAPPDRWVATLALGESSQAKEAANRASLLHVGLDPRGHAVFEAAGAIEERGLASFEIGLYFREPHMSPAPGTKNAGDDGVKVAVSVVCDAHGLAHGYVGRATIELVKIAIVCLVSDRNRSGPPVT
jgi:hypothetical protein